jgi:hypothetical protein
LQTFEKFFCKKKGRAITARPALQELAGRLIRGDDELYVGLAAHAVDGTGPAGSGGVPVASGLFGDDRDSSVRAANDGSRRIKRRRGTKIDDEAYVFAGALPLDRCSRFYAEE